MYSQLYETQTVMLDDGGSVVHTEEEEGTQCTGVYHLGRRSSSCILFILQQSLFDSNTQQLLGSTKRQLSRGHPIPQNKKNKKKRKRRNDKKPPPPPSLRTCETSICQWILLLYILNLRYYVARNDIHINEYVSFK